MKEQAGKKKVHASFCSGVDGPALSASWLGWEQAFYGDINEFTLQVLRYYYPYAKEYNDIRTTSLTEWQGKIDVLTIGFPCQPFSVAGQRTGRDHDSYLWPETKRLIKECRPRWFIGENVDGITSMVFPGMETEMAAQKDIFGKENTIYERIDEYIIERICQDIEQIGYEVYPVVIPACAVGAPHRRMRCFFIAYDTQNTVRNGCDSSKRKEKPGKRGQRDIGAGDYERICGEKRLKTSHPANTGFEDVQRERTNGILSAPQVADTEGIGQKQSRKTRTGWQGFEDNHFGRIPDWRNFPTQSPVRSRNDGFPGELLGLSLSQWSGGCIESLGNAIVPQQMLEMYKLIEIIDNQL